MDPEQARVRGGPLWSPLGSLQVRVVWRLIAWAMLLAVLRARGADPLAIDGALVPWPYHAIAAAASLLVIFGPRLVLLVALAAAWIWQQVYVLGAGDPRFDFVADEHQLFTLVPALAALSAGFCLFEYRGSPGAERDDAVSRGQLWQLRMCTLVALGFATLHKLNIDFLAPRSSCATLLGERLAERWGLPGSPLGPLGVLVLEGLAPVLLVLYPRLGVLWVVVLAAGLGHVGPYAFNALLVALALAFLPGEAARAWSRPPRWSWLVLLVGGLVGPGVSARLFAGSGAWWPFALFELTLAVVVWLVLVGGSAGSTPVWRPQRPARPLLPGRYAHRSLCVYAAIFLSLHGASPYLGLKYRHSFAMLSNLRVDDDRWNSLVIPRAVYLRATDPLVHVVHVRSAAGGEYRPERGDREALRPGVYSPQEFRRRYEAALRRWQALAIDLRYRGVEHRFGDLRFDGGLRGFAAGLPREPFFQDVLSGEAPQACVH